MSRSYREPWYTDGYKGSKRKQFEKKKANKRIRKSVNVTDGNSYRKYYDQWSICDYRFLMRTPYESKPWRVCRK